MVSPNPAIVSVGTSSLLYISTQDANGNTITLQNADFIFSSNTPTIATVDGNGLVTGVYPGTTTVTATNKFNSNITGEASVHVTALMAHVGSGTHYIHNTDTGTHSCNCTSNCSYNTAIDMTYISGPLTLNNSLNILKINNIWSSSTTTETRISSVGLPGSSTFVSSIMILE